MAAKPEIIEKAFKMAQARNKGLLTGIESQKGYIARLHLLQTPCWSCGVACSYYEAVGEDYNPDVYRGVDEPFHCPKCGVKMIYCVPIFAQPIPWYWGNPLVYSEKPEERAQP